MKKAVLVDSRLLAEVEQKSPSVHKFYCNSPLLQFEFVDYGTEETPMYMQKSVWKELKPVRKHFTVNGKRLMRCLRDSWIFGMSNLILPFADKTFNPNWKEIMDWKSLHAALTYPSYDFDSLTDSKSFINKENGLFNLIVCQEGQFHEAWKFIFKRHEYYNKLFMLYQENLHPKGIDPMDFFYGDISNN